MCDDPLFLLATKTCSAAKRGNPTPLFARSEHVITHRVSRAAINKPNSRVFVNLFSSWRIPFSYSFSNMYMCMHDLTYIMSWRPTS